MKTSRRLVASALSMGLGLTLWGCSTDTTQKADGLVPSYIPNPAVGVVTPLFDPTSATKIPLPNDLLRNPGTVDPSKKGLVDQIPNTPPFNAEPFTSVRTLRGFSTTGNVIIPFDGRVDANSVNPQTILMVEGPGTTDPPGSTGTNNTIACNLQVINPEQGGTGNSTIIMQPILPLKPFTNYFVVLTNNIQGGGRGIGSPAIATATKVRDPFITPAGNYIFPVPDTTAATLEPLRQFYQPVWARAESILGRDRSEIAMAFQFGTQPLFPAMAQLSATARADTNPGSRGLSNQVVQASTPVAVDTFYAGKGLAAIPHANVGRICTGTINPRNYMTPAAPVIQPFLPGSTKVAINPLNVTTGFFQGTGFPAVPPSIPADPVVPQGDLVVPYLCCLPITAGTPGLGYPTVIFQHGIDHNKDDMLRVADEFCRQGFAVIAIDLWLHGDLGIAAAGPVPDGTGFINPGNPRGQRDNIRQSASDLFYLSSAIAFGKGDVDTGTAGLELFPAFAPAPTGVFPRFVGFSLGGIVGTVFAATDAFQRQAVMNVSGGRLTDLLLNSVERGPVLKAQLAAAGLIEGTPEFRQFFLILQTVTDDADPMNYAAPGIAGALRGGATSTVFMQEVEGDKTLPNSATRDLARAFNQVPGFRHVQPVIEVVSLLTEIASPFTGSGFSQFGPGNSHELLIGRGADNPFPTAVRIQKQAATWLRTGSIEAP